MSSSEEGNLALSLEPLHNLGGWASPLAESLHDLHPGTSRRSPMTCSPCKGSLRSSVRAIILCVQLRAHPAAVSGLTGCGSFLLLLSVCPPSSSLHAGPMSFYGAHPFLLLYVLSSTLLSGHLGPAVNVVGLNKKSTQLFLRKFCTLHTYGRFQIQILPLHRSCTCLKPL